MNEEYIILIGKHRMAFTEQNLRKIRRRRNIEIRDLRKNIRLFHWKRGEQIPIHDILEKMIA